MRSATPSAENARGQDVNKSLNRRTLLRGLGGAVVAAPFLSSVRERFAKAEGTTVSTPKRLVTMFTHYGCLTNRWFPKKSHGALVAPDYEATTLKHLAPYASKLLMPRGIRAMNEWSFEGTYGQTLDPHIQVCGSFFTCHPVSGGELFTPKPTGRSLDHVVRRADPNWLTARPAARRHRGYRHLGIVRRAQ